MSSEETLKAEYLKKSEALSESVKHNQRNEREIFEKFFSTYLVILPPPNTRISFSSGTRDAAKAREQGADKKGTTSRTLISNEMSKKRREV